MDKFLEIISLCEADVSVHINPHKGVYESVDQYLQHRDPDEDEFIIQQMVLRDRIIEIMAHQDTPVGCYVVYHYDLEQAISHMLDILKRNKKT